MSSSSPSRADPVLLRPPLQTWQSLTGGDELASSSLSLSASVLASSNRRDSRTTAIDKWATPFRELLRSLPATTTTTRAVTTTTTTSREASSRGASGGLAAAPAARPRISIAMMQQQHELDIICAGQPRWIHFLHVAHFSAHFLQHLHRLREKNDVSNSSNKDKDKEKDAANSNENSSVKTQTAATTTSGEEKEEEGAAALADLIVESPSAVAQEIDSRTSLFAQRHPLIYDEASKYGRDILRLASWMCTEVAIRKLAKMQQKQQEQEEEWEREPVSSDANAAVGGNSNRRRVVNFPDHDGDEVDDEGAEQNALPGEENDDGGGGGDGAGETESAEAVNDEDSPQLQEQPPQKQADGDQSQGDEVNVLSPDTIATFIQHSLALFLVALYSQQRVIDGISPSEMWSTKTLQRLAPAAQLEAEIVLPSSFLRQYVTAEFLASAPAKKFDTAARVLSVRLGPWMGAVLGPLLSSRSAAASSSSSCWLDPISMRAILSDCRLSAEIVLGLAPLLANAPKSMMFDRASKMQSVASLSAAITRRARHVQFASANIINALQETKSFRSRPRSPPPEEAAVAATAAAVKEAALRSNSSVARSPASSAATAEVLVAVVEWAGIVDNNNEQQLQSVPSTDSKSGDEQIKSEASGKTQTTSSGDAPLAQKLLPPKRVPHLFADIPLAESDGEGDDEEVAEDNKKKKQPQPQPQRPHEQQQHHYDEDDIAQREEETLRRKLQFQLNLAAQAAATAAAAARQSGSDQTKQKGKADSFPSAAQHLPSRGVVMALRLKELLLDGAVNSSGGTLTLKHLLPVQAHNIVTSAVRRGVNLGSVAQLRSVGPKLLRESGLLVSAATYRRFLDKLGRSDESAVTGSSSSSSSPNSISLADVLSALDVQLGRGIVDAERLLAKEALAQREKQQEEEQQQQQRQQRRSPAKTANQDLQQQQQQQENLFFTVASSQSIPALVSAAAQVAFESSLVLSPVELQMAQLLLLAEYRRQHQQSRAAVSPAAHGAAVCRFTPAALVVALQDAVVKAQTSYLQQQLQQQKQKEKQKEEEKKLRAARRNAAVHRRGSPVTDVLSDDEDAGGNFVGGIEGSPPVNRRVARRVAIRPALPHYVTSSDSRGSVCAASRKPVVMPQRASPASASGGGVASSPSFSSTLSSPPSSATQSNKRGAEHNDAGKFSPSLPIEFVRFPLPGQFVAESVHRRRLVKALEEEERQHHLRKSGAIRDDGYVQRRLPACAFRPVAPGLEMVESNRVSAAVAEPSVGAPEGCSRMTVELVAMQRQLRSALSSVAVCDAVPAEMQRVNGIGAAQSLQQGAATATGVRALRALRHTDIGLRLAAPTGTRGELRSCTSMSSPDLSAGAQRTRWQACSVLDERHRALRRELRKLRREVKYPDDSEM